MGYTPLAHSAVPPVWPFPNKGLGSASSNICMYLHHSGPYVMQ